ncbi:MAG: PHP domain-containing protein [Simkaniaceae bacterium]|nr:PHP domain-containing protein [Simkaniaceae bacterium]
MHTHTTCSDGTMTPFELINEAKKIGLQGLSITDHDGVSAYTDELFDYARANGIQLMTGVEFSCRFEEMSIHILGYHFDHLNEAIQDLCKRHVIRRQERNLLILERLRGRGIRIEPEELKQKAAGVIGRPHIAKIMVEKGAVGSIQEAFEEYIGDNKPCYVPGASFFIPETIDMIHQAGGKALIAHPHLIRNKSVVKKLIQLPFDGIEAYYARFPLDQEREWLEIAEKKGWLISGGSDFHGTIKPHNPLGSSWIGLEEFKKL